MTATATEHDIFRAIKGLSIHPSLARTLAYSIFWSQHATHRDGESPMIWKTGPTVSADLQIAARTVNRHFKELAKLGYWTISYRPRPGTIGKVTWLTFTPRSLALLQLASERAQLRTTKKKGGKTSAGAVQNQPEATAIDYIATQDVTSKQIHEPAETAKNGKSFILSSEAGKKKMKEAPFSVSSGGNEKTKICAPKYLKATAADHAFAEIVRNIWISNGLKEWEWVSRYTWQHISEIRTKASQLGIAESDYDDFLRTLIKEWHWLRICMIPRYANCDLNLHAPTPMALNHEFKMLSGKVLEKINQPAPKHHPWSLDDDFA